MQKRQTTRKCTDHPILAGRKMGACWASNHIPPLEYKVEPDNLEYLGGPTWMEHHLSFCIGCLHVSREVTFAPFSLSSSHYPVLSPSFSSPMFMVSNSTVLNVMLDSYGDFYYRTGYSYPLTLPLKQQKISKHESNQTNTGKITNLKSGGIKANPTPQQQSKRHDLEDIRLNAQNAEPNTPLERTLQESKMGPNAGIPRDSSS